MFTDYSHQYYTDVVSEIHGFLKFRSGLSFDCI